VTAKNVLMRPQDLRPGVRAPTCASVPLAMPLMSLAEDADCPQSLQKGS